MKTGTEYQRNRARELFNDPIYRAQSIELNLRSGRMQKSSLNKINETATI